MLEDDFRRFGPDRLDRSPKPDVASAIGVLVDAPELSDTRRRVMYRHQPPEVEPSLVVAIDRSAIEVKVGDRHVAMPPSHRVAVLRRVAERQGVTCELATAQANLISVENVVVVPRTWLGAAVPVSRIVVRARNRTRVAGRKIHVGGPYARRRACGGKDHRYFRFHHTVSFHRVNRAVCGKIRCRRCAVRIRQATA